jgi:predicted aconitase
MALRRQEVVLTDEQKRMYGGEYGPGMQKAMTMLVKYGEVFGAERMVQVDSCHAGARPLPFVKEMLEGVDRVRAFTTLHAGRAAASMFWRALGIKEEFHRQEGEALSTALKLCISKGFIPALSCMPYLVGNVVKVGDIFSWPGSSGIIIANSLFGARGNRDAFPASLASSITGLTPEMLLLKKENRRGQVLVLIDGLDLENFTPADYGALGYYIGKFVGVRNVVVDGFPSRVSFEKLKYFLSSLPVSGAVSLCHIVGITPEAPSVEEALGKRKPEETITVGKKEFREGWESLHTAKTDEVEVVFFGCPQLSINEIGRIAQLLEGKKGADHVRLWVSTAESIYVLAKRMGYVKTIEKAGGLVITDSCIMGFPYEHLETEASMAATNSAKAASYQARSGINIQYGSTEQCIRAAVTGKWGG